MAIIGFGFSKFDCVRNSQNKQKNIQVNYNIGIQEVKKTTLKVGGGNDDVLKIDFIYSVQYGNDLGKIEIIGDVIFADTKEIISETEKGWKADKKLNQSVNEEVFRFVYSKATIKALELSDSLNLPSPVPLPKISFSDKKK